MNQTTGLLSKQKEKEVRISQTADIFLKDCYSSLANLRFPSLFFSSSSQRRRFNCFVLISFSSASSVLSVIKGRMTKDEREDGRLDSNFSRKV